MCLFETPMASLYSMEVSPSYLEKRYPITESGYGASILLNLNQVSTQKSGRFELIKKDVVSKAGF